jgi:uncharacterized protein
MGSARSGSGGLLAPSELTKIDSGDWRWQAFSDFADNLAVQSPSFPCIYATHALKHETLRLTFLDSPTDERSRESVAAALAEYVRICRALAPYTAFVAFFERAEADSHDLHRDHFWDLLQSLHEHDPEPWPADVPREPDDSKWEFCFAGEPMFALATWPSYRQRRSRHSETFIVSFQPRFQFDQLAETPELLERARTVIRKRVMAMDGMPIHPASKMYGDPENREWKQYVMPEDNGPITGACPFHHRAAA